MSEVARQLKERSRKTLTLPHSNLEVVIRKLDQERFIAHGGGGLLLAIREQQKRGEDPVAESDPDQSKMSDDDAVRYLKALVSACVVTPRVWTGDADACPDDQVIMADFGDDLPYLLEEINRFIGITQEAAAAAESFRNDVGRNAGSNRTAVSGSPDRDPQTVADAAVLPSGDLPDGDAAATMAARGDRA